MNSFCPHCGFETSELVDCQKCERTGCERCIEKSRLGWHCSNCRINKMDATSFEENIAKKV